MGLHHLLASTLGFCVAVTNSYLINKHWTFKTKGSNVRHEFAKFIIVNLVTLSINLGSMALLVEQWAMDPRIAQLASIGLTLSINFLGNKFWTFRKKPKPEELPGNSPICTQKQIDIDKIEKTMKENDGKLEKLTQCNKQENENLKQLINDIDKDILILKTQFHNATKDSDEMKQNVKEVATRLDDLLKQLMDWTE